MTPEDEKAMALEAFDDIIGYYNGNSKFADVDLAGLENIVRKALAPAPVAGDLGRVTDEHDKFIQEWAADDRLWTTQETVAINLKNFARKMIHITNSQAATSQQAREWTEDEIVDIYCKSLKEHRGTIQDNAHAVLVFIQGLAARKVIKLRGE